MRKSTESMGFTNPAAMWAWDGQSVDTMVNSYETWAKDWGWLQNESLRFMRHRLERNVEAATSLASCKSPADALQMQMRFAGDALNDYLGEGQKMMAMFGRSASIIPPVDPAK
jgi:hypothetical protein